MQIFIDIENTVIDDLTTCNLMADQCERIKNFVHSSNPDKVNIFTWGWKEHKEIRKYIVDWIFNALEIPAEQRGVVWTKDDSIQCAFSHKWVNTTDELELEDLHLPGAMTRFGMEKPTCFIQQCKDLAEFDTKPLVAEHFILIDDLNKEGEFETRNFMNMKNASSIDVQLINPKDLP